MCYPPCHSWLLELATTDAETKVSSCLSCLCSEWPGTEKGRDEGAARQTAAWTWGKALTMAAATELGR